MAIHKLTVRKVDTAGPGKYEDGGGLRLVVSPTGAKKWVLRYASQGKRREMGLGRYPDVGLADARTQALQGRRQVATGVDPIEARRVTPEHVLGLDGVPGTEAIPRYRSRATLPTRPFCRVMHDLAPRACSQPRQLSDN